MKATSAFVRAAWPAAATAASSAPAAFAAFRAALPFSFHRSFSFFPGSLSAARLPTPRALNGVGMLPPNSSDEEEEEVPKGKNKGQSDTVGMLPPGSSDDDDDDDDDEPQAHAGLDREQETPTRHTPTHLRRCS